MNKISTELASNQTVASNSEFAGRIQKSIEKSQETGRPFMVVLLQIANMKGFRAQRSQVVVNNLLRELNSIVRKAVHPDQFVGIYQDGLGLVFDMLDVGQVDILSRKLVMLAQHTIKNGKYNDLSSRWTDIIYQFLWPNKPGIIYPSIGWAVYPRDGQTPRDMVKRAFNHITELLRQRSA